MIYFAYTFHLNLDCFDHGEDYTIKDTCIDKANYEKCQEECSQSDGKDIADCQKKCKTCPMTINAKVCEPSTTENTVSQNLH